MEQSTTLPIPGPTGPARDVLTDILRDGARRLLAEAVEAEVAAWIDAHAHLKDEAALHGICEAEGRAKAEKAFALFVSTYEAK